MNINRIARYTTHQQVPCSLRAGTHRQLRDRLITAELVGAVALRLVRVGPMGCMLQEVANLLVHRLGLCCVGIWLDDGSGRLFSAALSVESKLPLPLDEIEKRIDIIAQERVPLRIMEPEITSDWGPPLACAANILRSRGCPLGVLIGFSNSSLSETTLQRLDAVSGSIAVEVQLRMHGQG